MLRVTFTGPGASTDEPKVWFFNPDEVDVEEAERIEDAMGARWSDFVSGVIDGTARARRVLYWHLIRRDHPTNVVAFKATPSFRMGDMTIELGTVEIDKVIAGIEGNELLESDRRQRIVDQFKVERLAAAEAEAALEADADPKEPLDDDLGPHPMDPSAPNATST